MSMSTTCRSCSATGMLACSRCSGKATRVGLRPDLIRCRPRLVSKIRCSRRSVREAGSEIAKFVEQSGSNAFVRNLIWALTDLYDLGEDGITAGNWQRLDAEIRRRHQDDHWRCEVLDRAGIERIITDPFDDPLLDAHEVLGERYCSVLRINALAFGWHPESCDHNGNSAHRFAQQIGHRMNSFDDYLALLEVLMDTLAERHQVGLKNALAYDRSVHFDDVDEDLARQAWGQAKPPADQRKAFGDVVVDRLCRLAGERGVPLQMHLGSAQIRRFPSVRAPRD